MKIPPSENRPLENCPQENYPQKINPKKLAPYESCLQTESCYHAVSGGHGFCGSTDIYLI